MKKLAAIVMLFVASTAEALPPLSSQAVSAFYNWHLCAPPGVPPSALAGGSRRFAGNTVTWKVQPTGQWTTYVRQAMTKINTWMVDPTGLPVMTYQEVAWNQPANVTWRIGSTYTPPGYPPQTIQSGCVWNPLTVSATSPQTYLTTEVVCKYATGQVGLNLALHEQWWHGMLTFCHTANGFGGGGGENGAPNYEGVPGHREIARWIYSVPPASFPPQ